MKLIFHLLLIVFFVSCTETKKDEKKEDMNYLIFQFHDSSVPPPYHRSYELRFEGSEVHIIVDSYGDILADETIEIGEENVAKAFELVRKYEIQNKEENDEDEGCTGGTGISIAFGTDEELYCDGYVYFCGGEQFGDLSGELQSLKSELKELIPSFNDYLKEE